MSHERAWVETVKADIEGILGRKGIKVATGYRLPYALQVASYKTKSGEMTASEPVTRSHGYQTDLLIAERLAAAADWVPRVVVEFKLGSVSTHDALTYSAKAATHKNVHPYLRYGIVIGGYEGQVPKRLIRHGDHFDFMLTLPSQKLTKRDRDRLTQLLNEEVEASRTISALLSERSDIWLLHRKLEVRS